MKGTVGVVGGGLAGLAAGCALADEGYQVTVFERRPFVGGRASSYEHLGTNEVVDNCQHVLLGCCTNLIDLYRRFGAEDKIRWFDRLTFVEPGGRRSEIYPSILPAPFHTAPSFLDSALLSFADKMAIGRGLLSLIGRLPEDTSENFHQWLLRHGQTPTAIDRFWKVVLVSAINEDLDRISVRYGAQVFRESFLKSPEAGRMGVPRVPLTELYSAAIGYIQHRRGSVRLRAAVDGFQPGEDGVILRLAHENVRFDHAVLAVPYNALPKIVPADSEGTKLAEKARSLEGSPITGIHLWFDRQVTELEHAVLLDRTIQWFFHKSLLLAKHSRNGSAQEASYVELVVSASKSLVEKPRQEIIDLALKELTEFFPAVADCKLIKATVIKEVHATYSAQPLSDANRPATRTAWRRVFLAGDWTATGWPATMEGAVRSGYQAAAAITGRPILVPDLAPAGLMRLFG